MEPHVNSTVSDNPNNHRLRPLRALRVIGTPPASRGHTASAVCEAVPKQDKALLDATLSYANRGWRVFPVKTGTKVPAILEWPNRATNEVTQIETWWGSKFPGANIGVVCGMPSNVVVLDLDPRNGGEESLIRLIEKYGPLPDTLTVYTPSLGRHYWFQYPGDGPSRKGPLSRDFPGLDLQADGAMVVVPPSRTEKGVYTFANDPETPLAPLPAFLIELRERDRIGGPSARGQVLPAAVPAPPTKRLGFVAAEPLWRRNRNPSFEEQARDVLPGQRNNWLFAKAGVLRTQGFAGAALLTKLQSINGEMPKPLDDEEVEQIAESVERY